jgi:hypothetical protein
MCGRDSVCTEQSASEDADLLYRIASAEAERRDIYANFYRYYVEHEHDRQGVSLVAPSLPRQTPVPESGTAGP